MPADREGSPHPATRQIRGSTLLMGGRGIALALNFAAQILTVRYLAKLDYGALAYALAMVTLLSRFSRLGMDKAASRFAALYHERGDRARLLGSLLLMGSTIILLGVATVLAVFGLRGLIGSSLASNPLSLALLLTLVALAPIDALDVLLQSLFAVFSRPRLIFFRRHVAGPSLKLLAVLGVILAGGDVRLLAVAHLLAGVCALLIGATLAARVLRERRLLSGIRLRELIIPFRQVFGFGLPMMGSDLVFILRGTLVVVLLEYFHGSGGVADFRAVLPVARLNRVALDSFAFLFMPAVARLLAREDSRRLNELFWRSTIWVTVLAFPVFSLTFAFAKPVTLLLFGDRYAGSAPILALLALGIFLHAAVGLNALALKAAGKVRRVLAIDAAASAIGLGLALLLIPRHGALGGALSFAATLVAHSLLYQIALSRSTGIRLFPRGLSQVYAGMAAVTLVLWSVQWAWSPPIWVAVGLAGGASLLVLTLAKRLLDVERTFPELLRLPLIGRFVGGPLEARRRAAEES